MLKTNSKKACENIRSYINDEIENWLIEYGITTDHPVTELFNVMNIELPHRRIVSEREMFNEWLQGLAFCGDDIYYHPGVREIVANWLEETPEEAVKYKECDIEKLAVNLIYRELKKIQGKENR